MAGFSTDGLNFGLGLRGGKTLPNHVYVGGSFVYNTGQSEAYYPYAGYGVVAAVSTASASLFYVGPEAGYDIVLKYVTLRAYSGVGIAHTTVSYSAVSASYAYLGPPSVSIGGSASATTLAIWPGMSAEYVIPRTMFFVGGDVRLLVSIGHMPAEGIADGPALGFFGYGGVKFGS
jgi:hypothetical protein